MTPAEDPQVFLASGDASAASGIGLALFDERQRQIIPNALPLHYVPIITQEMTFHFTARYRAMFNYLKSGFILLLALFSAASVQAAGGIALGATRVIYPADAKQTSLSISNSDTKERYLVNSWIENSAGAKEKSFVVTPPLFVSEPKSENTLRIIYAGEPLPKDRESLFWMNVKAIPSVNKNSLEGKNVLQLAILSRIKSAANPGRCTRNADLFPLRQPPENQQSVSVLRHVGQSQCGENEGR